MSIEQPSCQPPGVCTGSHLHIHQSLFFFHIVFFGTKLRVSVYMRMFVTKTGDFKLKINHQSFNTIIFKTASNTSWSIWKCFNNNQILNLKIKRLQEVYLVTKGKGTEKDSLQNKRRARQRQSELSSIMSVFTVPTLCAIAWPVYLSFFMPENGV